MLRVIAFVFFSLVFLTSYASNGTRRVPQFKNKEVNVWETIISPKHPLQMHHHSRDHVVIALTSGMLRVIPEHGRSHLVRLQKGRAYWLPKDKKGALHADLNIGKKPLKVIMVEIKSRKNNS